MSFFRFFTAVTAKMDNPGAFELAGIPYVGCGVLSSALAMDKAYAKVIFEKRLYHKEISCI